MLNRIISFFVAVFLLFNLVVRIYSLHSHGVSGTGLSLLAGGLALCIWFRPALLNPLCLLLGLSLPLYGFQSYTLYNHVFEFVIVLLGCQFFLAAKGRVVGEAKGGRVVTLFACYILLALLSLQLLPFSLFLQRLSLWGVFDFSNYLFSVSPENPLYSVAAVNRLLLFFLFICLLNQTAAAGGKYKRIFTGCAISVIGAGLLGVLNQFDIMSLTWYRPNFRDASGVARLHSVLGNPGWFAEYMVLCTPFLLLFFNTRKAGFLRLSGLSTLLVLVAVSLLLSGSRSSWLIFSVLLGFFCFAVLLYGKAGAVISWRDVRLATIRVACIGLVCSCLLGGGILLMSLGSESRQVSTEESTLSRTEYLVQRIQSIAAPEERLKVWQESLALVAESPLYGLGYESYRWHMQVMGAIADSNFTKSRQTTIDWETAHNLYIQLSASNGLVGLGLWLLLISFICLLLGHDAFVNRSLQSFVLLMVIFGFHAYGLAQSMQYVASIWFLLILIIGYAMLIDRRVQVPWMVQSGRLLVGMAFIAVAAGAIVYGSNMQSHLLAERYGLPVYGQESNGAVYSGFYPLEDWGEDGYYRWSGRAAEIRMQHPGVVQFGFACYAPRLAERPIRLDVTLNGRLIDTYLFETAEKVTREYMLSTQGGQAESRIRFHVSRTWCPQLENMNADSRHLGVAVSEPEYL